MIFAFRESHILESSTFLQDHMTCASDLLMKEIALDVVDSSFPELVLQPKEFDASSSRASEPYGCTYCLDISSNTCFVDDVDMCGLIAWMVCFMYSFSSCWPCVPWSSVSKP